MLSKMAKQYLIPGGYMGKGCVGQTQCAWRRRIRSWSEAVGDEVAPQHWWCLSPSPRAREKPQGAAACGRTMSQAGGRGAGRSSVPRSRSRDMISGWH